MQKYSEQIGVQNFKDNSYHMVGLTGKGEKNRKIGKGGFDC
jgi:hypothetical protein